MLVNNEFCCYLLIFTCLLNTQRFITFKIGEKLVYVDISSCNDGGYWNIECMKAEVACVYYLQLSEERRAKGMLETYMVKLYTTPFLLALKT